METLTRERRPARATRLRSAFTGADGNVRLTATTGLVLLVLLPIEGLTLLSLHSFLVAPALVASTIGLFGSGVALMLLKHPNSLVFAIHKGSFIIWLGAIGIHVLAYLHHLPRLAVADWVRGKQEAVGRRLRRRAVAASLLAGGGVAMMALALVAAWHR